MRGGIRTHCSRGHAHGPCRGRRVSVFTPPSNRPIAIPPRGGDEWLKHDRKPGGALTARGGAENGSVPVAVGRADPTLRGRRHWAFWGGRIQFAVRAAPPFTPKLVGIIHKHQLVEEMDEATSEDEAAD